MTVADLRSRMNHGAEGFLRWWAAALADCVPARLRAILAQRPSALLLCPEAGAVAVRSLRRGRLREVGSVALPAHGGAAAPLLRAAGRHGETWLCLPASAVLRTVVELPGAAAENLREVIGFELDRLSPFDAADARFDYRVLGGDPAARTIRVELTVAARAVVDRALESVRGLGFEPGRVSVVPPGGPAGSWPDLAAGDESGDEGRTGRWTTRGLAAVAALLLVALGVVPLHLQRARLADLEDRVAGLRARALEVDALKQRLAERDGEMRRLVALKTGRPGVTELLDEVTRLLPDHTWVVQFALRDGQVTLAGFSSAASALIAPLEASALLREVRFGAPVYTDPQVGLERFTLSAAVEGMVEGMAEGMAQRPAGAAREGG